MNPSPFMSTEEFGYKLYQAASGIRSEYSILPGSTRYTLWKAYSLMREMCSD